MTRNMIGDEKTRATSDLTDCTHTICTCSSSGRDETSNILQNLSKTSVFCLIDFNFQLHHGLCTQQLLAASHLTRTQRGHEDTSVRPREKRIKIFL